LFLFEPVAKQAEAAKTGRGSHSVRFRPLTKQSRGSHRQQLKRAGIAKTGRGSHRQMFTFGQTFLFGMGQPGRSTWAENG